MDGSPLPHAVASPVPSPLLLGDPCRRPCFETRILLRTAVVDTVEAELTTALVAMVGGTRPATSPQEVKAHLILAF
jgi:hypothetical protein